MTNAHQDNFLSVLAGLHHNSEYSDLTITCEGREFKVHRAIVCRHSSMISNEINSNFTEGKTGVVSHAAYNAATVERMLSYMYTQSYRVTGDRTTTTNTNVFDDEKTAEAVMDDIHEKTTQALIDHVHVHGVADYYDIPLLQKLAADRFCELLRKRWPGERVAEVICEVYGCAGSHDKGLVNGSLAAASSHATKLMSDAKLLQRLTEKECHNEFVYGLVRQLSASLEQICIARDTESQESATTTQQLRNHNEETTGRLKTVTADLTQEKKDIIGLEQLLVIARCCRHCRWDHKIFIERTAPHENGRHCLRCGNCGSREEGRELSDIEQLRRRLEQATAPGQLRS